MMVKRVLIRGFSLVELMVAIGLGAIVTTGVVQLFVANSDTHDLLVGQSRMQESARFAMDFIGRQVRQAGYKGCFSGGSALFATIDPANNIPYEFDMRLGIQGYESINPTTWNPNLDELPNTDTAASVFSTTYGYGAGNGIDLDQVASFTDVVTFRHLSQTDARVGGYINGGIVRGAMPSSTEPVVLTIPVGWSEFDLDHLVMIHDCEKATLFRVTTSNPWGRNGDGSPKAATVAADLTVGHDIDNVDTTRNSFTRLAEINTFGVDASVSAIESHTFYIAPGAGLNNDGNAPMSLWRKSTVDPPIELVEGVENLQLLYGSDTDQDGVPNQYLQANFIPDWQRVVTVRITLVVNSVDNVGSTSTPTLGCAVQDCVDGETYDGLIRRTFSQTIQLRNQD